MEGELGRLGHAPDKEAQGHGHEGALGDDLRRIFQKGGHATNVQGVEKVLRQEKSCQEKGISEPVDDEGLVGGLNGLRAKPVVGHQEGESEAHELPEEEDQQEVPAGHEQKENPRLHADQREKSFIVCLSQEVSKGVGLHHRADPGDQKDHDRRKPVHPPERGSGKSREGNGERENHRPRRNNPHEEPETQKKGRGGRKERQKGTTRRSTREEPFGKEEAASTQKRQPG